MRYRPDYMLRYLRSLQEETSVSASLGTTTPQQEPHLILRLPWLRTWSINYNHVPFEQREALVEETLAAQQRSVLSCAVQRVTVATLTTDPSNLRLCQYIASLPMLVSLDLRGNFVWISLEEFLSAVADAHP